MAIYGRRRGGLGNTIRLGLRLARTGGKMRMSLVIAGATIGSLLILIAFSFQHAVSSQAQRVLNREAYYEPVEIPQDEFLDEVDAGEVFYGPETLPINPSDESSTLHIYWMSTKELGIPQSGTVLVLTGDGPSPPGVSGIPSASQAYVSPALKKILSASDEAPEIIAGKELLEISQEELRNPNELLAYIGTSESQYPGDLSEESPVVSWGVKISDGSFGYAPGSDMVFAVFAFLLAPAIVLLATTTRLASSVRTERMAALRLIGVSRRRTQLIAGTEAGVLATLGVVFSAFAMFPIARFSEGLNVLGVSWFASDFRPSAAFLATTIAFVPVLTVLTALVVLRKVSQNPLQIRRKAANPKPSYMRLVPLGIGLTLLGLQSSGFFDRFENGLAPVTPYLFMFASLTTGIGILVAVPVAVRRLARLLGRGTSRPTLLLAARRIQYEPAVLNRLVGGFVLALFIGTAGQAVILAFKSTPQYRYAHAAITGETTTIGVSTADEIAPEEMLTSEDIATLPGVSGLFEFREISTWEVSDEVGEIPTRSLIVSCQDLSRFGEFTGDCVGADVLRLTDWDESTYSVGHDDKTIELGHVDRYVNFEADYGLGYYSLAFSPDSPIIANFIDVLPAFWLVDLPANKQAWADFESALAAVHPDYWLHTPDLSPLDDVDDVRNIIWIGTGLAGAIALITLLTTAIDNSIARRPQIAMQRAFGVSLARVRRTQVLQALLPLAVGVPLAGMAGILAGQAYITLDNMTITTSYWSAIGIALGLATIAAVCVALATLPAIGGKISPQSLRKE